MPSPLQILLVEDNAADADLILRELERAGFAAVCKRIETELAFLENLHASLDLIISDYNLPQFSAPRALELLKQSGLAVPFIIVSGMIGEDTAVAAMKLGALDYLLKDRLGRLGPAVSHVLEQNRLRRENKEADEARRRGEEDFRLLFASNPAPMWVYDLQTLKFLAVNQAAIVHYGYDETEFLKLTIQDIRPPEDLPTLLETVKRRPAGVDNAGIWRHRAKDGRLLFVEVTTHQINFQGHDAELVLLHDVTQQRANENARRESEARFRQVVENIHEVFWMTNVEKTAMLYVSPAYAVVWGRSCASLMAKPRDWINAVHPDDQERIRHAAFGERSSGTYDETYRILRPNGETRWIRDRAAPVKDDLGNVVRIVGVAEDITERKQFESQFLRAQRMEAIGTLASGLAHDLNNILAPMLIAAGLLKENTTDAHDRELLTLVERSARRGADIVRQLLTFNRESDGARVPVQFRHLLAEMKAIVCETFPREITLVEEIPNDLWPVIADATQLHQLLVNLCVNARDAMPRGGTLLLRAENLEFSESDARSRPEAKAGPYVMLSVDDTGTGISADIVDRIFDPFFTTKGSGKGTGLGLSSVLGIVRSHGGFITVNSEPGRGSSFKIYLRAMPSAPEETSEPAAAPSSLGGNGETILVVDDEESIRDTTRHVLEKHNYRVRTAADGKEAVVAFMQHRAAVRLVLTDTMMPKMGGTALVRALRLLEPNLKFIIASGLDPELERATFTSLGVTEIVSKPCSPTVLLEAIQRQLRSG